MTGIPRMMFGNLGGGVFGCRISKPGSDVTGATPDILFDSSSIAYQKVLNGETILLNAASSGGTYVTNVPLPAAYASYSDLQVWANLYYFNTSLGLGNVDLTTNPNYFLKFRVVSGVLRLTFITPGGWPGPGQPAKSSWAIFNAKVQ